MATSSNLRTIGIALIALVALVLATYLATPPAERVSAQDGGTATTAGELVVVPSVVQVGQTTLAVGFHVVPRDLEVVIEYSEHFTPEGESCDTAGATGTTQAAAAPTWVTLNACTVGKGYVRLLESATGNLIEDVSVTVAPPGAPRQQRVSVTIDDLASAELVPGGSGDRFSVSATGLEAHREHNLHTVVLNNLSAAFNRGCTTFSESDSIVGHTSTIEYYTVYGCVAPGNRIWSYVEEVDGRTLASSGISNNPVNVEDPTVSFKNSSYDVNEGSGATVTVELSHPSTNIIRVPIRVSPGTDRNVTFRNRSTSESFPVMAEDDPDCDDETVNLRFDTLPSSVSRASSPSSARVTIRDDDVCVSFGSPSYSVDEGSSVTVEVELDDAPGRTVRIPVRVSDGSRRTLTFGSRSTSQTFPYTARQDPDSDDETVNLSFGSLPPGVAKGAPSSARIIIRDDDEPNVPPTFNEGGRTTRSVAENSASNTNVGSRVTASDADGDDLGYSLSGTHADLFRIGRTSGQIRTFAPLNFETRSSYSVTVTVDDGNGGSDRIDVIIRVNDVNERPTITFGSSRVSYAENGTGAVATYTADDPDGDSITWSLTGPDRRDFTISGGVLRFRNSPDFENPHDSNPNNDYEITVRASDGRLNANKDVTIRVTDVNERPEVELAAPNRTLAPGVASREIDLSHYFSDPDGDTLIYSATSDAVGVATTRVRGNTLTLERVSAGSATITVTAADRSPGNADRLTASQAFGVTVDETNVPPTFVEDDPATRFVAENTPSNTNIGNPVRASDEDVDDTLTYSLSGTDAGSFAIDDDNGQILTSDPLDFETKNSYSVTVTVDDGNGGTATIDVTITVVNVAPTITSGPHWVDYDEGDTVSAGDYDASDPGGGDISWSLSGTDAGDFRISRSGVLRFRSTPDFENPRDDGPNNEYEITVNASDGDLADSLNVTISVNNLAPTITSGDDRVRYDENRTDAVKNYEASDPGGGDVSWSIPSKSAGTDKHDFAISDEGVLTFEVTPDFENPHDENIDNVYTFKVRASDDSGSMADLDVTIEVTDVDEPPGRPSRPTVISNGETSLNVEWSAPTNTGPPINDYDVQYRLGSSGPFTSATHTGTATQTTISDLDTDSTYEVQVRARNAEGTSAWSQSGTGSTDAPPVPTVTIAPLDDADSVGEGQLVPFTLTAKPAPTTELKVKVSVTETGSFLTGPIPTKVTIGAGSETALLTLQTSDDAVDEENGTVTATVEPGDGYSVGSPSSANVTVLDDDLSRPPQPEGVSASSASGDSAEVRWSHRNGIEVYRVQYRDADKRGWRSVDVDASSPGSVTDRTTITSLECETRYRFRVRGWGDGVSYLVTWGPYSDIVYATTGDCGPVTPPQPPTPTPDPPSEQYAPLVEPPEPSYWCRNYPPLLKRVKHTGSPVRSADGRHEAQVELYSTPLLHEPNSFCIEARLISESTPGADRVSWGGKLYKTERFLNLAGLDPEQLGFLGPRPLLDRYEVQPLTDHTPYFRKISRSCEMCRGGTIQTVHKIVETRVLKVPTIYAVGEHTFSVGDASVALASRVEFEMKRARFDCETPQQCLIEQELTFEEELSEDIDTGLYGDLVTLIGTIIEFLEDFEE